MTKNFAWMVPQSPEMQSFFYAIMYDLNHYYENYVIEVFSGDTFFDSFFKDYEGVYLIDKIYIGRTKNLGIRIKQHLYNAIRKKHHNKKLQQYLINKFNKREKLVISIVSPYPEEENEFIEIGRSINPSLFNFNPNDKIQ